MTLSKYLDFFRLSTSDYHVLAELTADKFGIVKLDEEEHAKKKRAALKAVALLEQAVSGFGVDNWRKGGKQDARAYRKLGHLHLLLENYPRALSAYEKYGELAGEAAAEADPDYLYGRAQVFFHFHAYHPACEAFQRLLFLYPQHPRRGEAHVRLGLMRKVMKSFKRSQAHFK